MTYTIGQRVKPASNNPDSLAHFETTGLGTIVEVSPSNGDEYAVVWDLSEWPRTYMAEHIEPAS